MIAPIRMACFPLILIARFSSFMAAVVKGVEDMSCVEYGVLGNAGLMRVGTRIAQNELEIHRGIDEGCGNGGNRGAGWRCIDHDFQFP
jgi:hypothetical protein